MALLRTPINIPVSSIIQKVAESLSNFQEVEISRPLKPPLPGKKLFICVAVLILSTLAGAITPLVLASLVR